MGNFKMNWRRAALPFVGWTMVSIIFAGISYAAAIGENNKEYGFVAALRLNLVQFYVCAILAHLVFRFNTLHSISSLVLEDPRKANSMIAQLGDFLRLTMENSEQQLVTLKEETEFLRCYLDIEQVRFGDRLTVAFQLEPQTLSALVPHLILQPVVENAIQHAIAPRAAGGHINIEAKRLKSLLQVAITDNGPGIRSTANSPAKKC